MPWFPNFIRKGRKEENSGAIYSHVLPNHEPPRSGLTWQGKQTKASYACPGLPIHFVYVFPDPITSSENGCVYCVNHLSTQLAWYPSRDLIYVFLHPWWISYFLLFNKLITVSRQSYFKTKYLVLMSDEEPS